MQTLVRGSTKPATVRLDGPMKPSPLSLLLMSEHQPATAPSGGTTPPAADATESASPATTETPVADVATEVGAPTGTVKARLSRGRATLARLLNTDLEVRHA